MEPFITVQITNLVRALLVQYLTNAKPGAGKDKVKTKRRMRNILMEEWTEAKLDEAPGWSKEFEKKVEDIYLRIDDIKDLRGLVSEILEQNVTNGTGGFALVDLDEALESIIEASSIPKEPPKAGSMMEKIEKQKAKEKE